MGHGNVLYLAVSGGFVGVYTSIKTKKMQFVVYKLVLKIELKVPVGKTCFLTVFPFGDLKFSIHELVLHLNRIENVITL